MLGDIPEGVLPRSHSTEGAFPAHQTLYKQRLLHTPASSPRVTETGFLIAFSFDRQMASKSQTWGIFDAVNQGSLSRFRLSDETNEGEYSVSSMGEAVEFVGHVRVMKERNSCSARPFLL